jgi:hypothetical protein
MLREIFRYDAATIPNNVGWYLPEGFVPVDLGTPKIVTEETPAETVAEEAPAETAPVEETVAAE